MTVLSIYRNDICIMYRKRTITGQKPGGTMDFDLSPLAEQWQGKLQSFFDREVLPLHRAWLEHVAVSSDAAPFMAELQDKARAQGLWNLGLPELAENEPGT